MACGPSTGYPRNGLGSALFLALMANAIPKADAFCLTAAGVRQEALRQWIFTLAGRHPVDFDTLMEKLGTVPTSWLRRVVHEPPATAA